VSGDVVRVLCCEDVDDEEVFDREFERDWRRRGGGSQRRLERHGPTRPTLTAAWGALERAAGHGEPPDVVLIDNYLKGRDGALVESAFELLRRIVERFGDDRPLCILCTTRFEPGVAHAFCEQGGVNAVDKLVAWEDRLAVVWRSVDGERWRHSPSPPLVDFTPGDLNLLPYLEADVSARETAVALGLSTEKVHDARRLLHARLQRAGCVDFELAGHTRALADAALEAGAIWTPLRYRAPAPARGPETPADR
jgi:CheY-like chemotaxis protein